MPKFCYWSVGDESHGKMLHSLVVSARAVGVEEDILLWTDQSSVAGATVHPAANFDKSHYLFKLNFLREKVQKLDYDYYVFVDADTFFVRNPGDVTHLCGISPIHVSLESYCTNPMNKRADWWGCPLPKYESFSRELGVRSARVYNCNAGFWIVHRRAVNTIFDLSMHFHDYCKGNGYIFTEEAPLAYAMQMLCGDTEPHVLRNTTDVWATDWIGIWKDQLPNGSPFQFEDYFTGERFEVNPAIVHAMRSKELLIKGKLK